ncbi:hypothetical protein [Acinetobacter entericus]|uniref:Uncharacterized protein n=1 Tax=Acinetobacter entericus TaxID=2989714 RepID=A0ABT3NED2_9GAMM|nr:hypothetical protein [Acinetobacter entericus]MCW8037912.1 hypothetical protein [Acinetobacter entericus]
MKEIASHSNTPVFVKNESNTKPVLYRHPTAEEMQTPFSAFLIADLKDSLIAGLILLVSWCVLSLILTALFGA